MIKNDIVEYNEIKYRYLGNGCKATGVNEGWRMSKNLYMRCVGCGYIMSANPNIDDSCSCGKLYKDSGYGRIGSRLGDDAIEVYERV